MGHRTGAHILAPCVGNRHGSYKPFPGGPESQWDLKLLEKLAVQFKGRIPICAHGVRSCLRLSRPDEVSLRLTR